MGRVRKQVDFGRPYLDGMPLRPFNGKDKIEVKVVMAILHREGHEFNKKKPFYEQVNVITASMTEEDIKALYGEAMHYIEHLPPFMLPSVPSNKINP